MGFSPLRIERKFVLGGLERKLVFSNASICEMEDLLGRSVIGEVQRMAMQASEGGVPDIRFDFLRAVICGAIRAAKGNRSVTPAKAAEWIPNDIATLGELYAEILPVMVQFLGVQPDATEDAELVEDGEKKAVGQSDGPSLSQTAD